MSKLIVDNQSALDDRTALVLVGKVLSDGDVSTTNGKKHPCHVSVFKVSGLEDHVERKFAVHCLPNYKSNRFLIENYRGGHEVIYWRD